MATPRKTAQSRPAGVKAPTDHQQPTPASSWKKAGAVLTLPSGNTMRLKNPGIMELAHQGLIPNALMSYIMDSVTKGSTELTGEDIMSDANVKVEDMFDMMANAIMMMAVDPQVYPVPEEGQARDDNLLYIDEIDEQDKLFIWQWATGGTADVEQFRQESTGVLGAMARLQGVEPAAKRASSRKR
jgi:hypothetical protein